MPFFRTIDRVIHAISATERHVRRGNTQVLEKRRKIRSRSKIPDHYVSSRRKARSSARCILLLQRNLTQCHSTLQATCYCVCLQSSSSYIRVAHLAEDFTNKVSECGRCTRCKVPTERSFVHLQRPQSVIHHTQTTKKRTLRYATVRSDSTSGYCSAYSVEPMSPYSSASQDISFTVRCGRQPS